MSLSKQTPHAPGAGHDGEMLSSQRASCTQLKWFLDRLNEHPMTTAQVAVLAALLALQDEQGASAKITKAKLGALVGLSERQVATVLKQLETDIRELIKSKRDGGAGKGRGANSYTVNVEANGNPVPEAGFRLPEANGNGLPELGFRQPSYRQPASGSANGNGLPVACEQKSAPYKNASARAETPILNITTLSELNPETPNPASTTTGVVVAVTKDMVDEALARAGASANLTSGDVHHGAEFNRLLRGGCDWEADVLPAIDALAASFAHQRKTFRSWRIITEKATENRDRRLAGLPPPAPVHQLEQRRRRPGQPANGITPMAYTG